MVAAAAALLMVGATGALYYYGLPAWAQGLGLGGATGEPDLVIELPPNQDHRELPDGTIYFAASGVIIHLTDREQCVPPILASSAERRVGKECVSQCSSPWTPGH